MQPRQLSCLKIDLVGSKTSSTRRRGCNIKLLVWVLEHTTICCGIQDLVVSELWATRVGAWPSMGGGLWAIAEPHTQNSGKFALTSQLIAPSGNFPVLPVRKRSKSILKDLALQSREPKNAVHPPKPAFSNFPWKNMILKDLYSGNQMLGPYIKKLWTVFFIKVGLLRFLSTPGGQNLNLYYQKHRCFWQP